MWPTDSRDALSAAGYATALFGKWHLGSENARPPNDQGFAMVSPAVKLGIPLLFNLYTNPREDEEKVATDTLIIGPALKMLAEFEASVKKHPLIAMGTPDP